MEATNPHSMDYLYGFSVHFYADAIISPDVLDETKKQFPDKVIINSESCEASTGYASEPGVTLGSWSRAHTYILSYMQVNAILKGIFKSTTIIKTSCTFTGS